MEKITVVRHLRTEIEPTLMTDNTICHGISNLGGITFVFELIFNTHGTNTVRYAYSMCHKDDNFDRSKGTQLASAKLANGDAIDINSYDPEESLLFNAFNDLYAKARDKDPIFMQKKLYRLRSMMKQIADSRIRAADIIDALCEVAVVE